MLKEILEKEGIVANSSLTEDIITWKRWYKGFDPTFHTRTLTTADATKKQIRVYSSNLAKKSVEDLGKLIWAEGMEISAQDDVKKVIEEVLNNYSSKFYKVFPLVLEKGLALGSFALVELIENDEIVIDYITADQMLPYRYTNKTISAFATLTQKKGLSRSGKTVYHNIVTLHDYDGIFYKKKHLLYISKEKNAIGNKTSFTMFYPDVQAEIEIATNKPYFQIYVNPITNNLNDSPMGISIFANSIDRLKAIDSKYDSFDNEFKLGRKRIIVDSSLIKEQSKVDETGNVSSIRYFDTNDLVYQAINGGLELKEPLKEIDFKLRTMEHIEAINSELNWYSANIGLGQDFYNFSKGGVKTATEVISQDNEAYRTALSYRKALKEILEDMINVIFELKGIQNAEFEISFGDGVITDTETARANARLDVASGLMSKKYYLMNYRHLTEEEAEKELIDISETEEINNIEYGLE